jgi:hypothetical protein
MKAKEWLKEKGIHPTEPIYWDTCDEVIYLDELLDEYAKFTSDNSNYNKLLRITEIAHRGGLENMSPSDAIQEVRKLTIDIFKNNFTQ